MNNPHGLGRLGAKVDFSFGLAWLVFPVLLTIPGWGREKPKEPYMAVVRQVTGSVHLSEKDSTVSKEMKLGDIVPTGRTLFTKENGLLILRYHPDFARLEARVNTRFYQAYSRIDSTKPRRIKLETGVLVLGVPKRSPPMQIEDTHSQARVDNARFSFASDPNVATTMVVVDGSVSIRNRSKDVTAVVRHGQKAISDVNGLRISDASDSEMEQVGLRQNILEIDFWNPTTEEFTTLEAEYESNF